MLAEGTIVVMDIDRLGELVKKKGWSEYRPNPATGTLTLLAGQLASRWGAVVVYGIDEERGTEEVVLEIPGVEPEELEKDLRSIKDELEKLGVCVTIVAVKGFVGGRTGTGRRQAYMGSPDRRRAKRILESLKRKGGCRLYVE